VSDDVYSKIMGECSGLGCSTYDYLKMLVEMTQLFQHRYMLYDVMEMEPIVGAVT
jgi:hypothetical protein